MAKGKLKASLREFLHGGTLGPIAIGVPMQAVGDCLGPPKYWSFSGTGIPYFWGYDHLELRFSERSPYKVESLQLSHAEELGGAGVSLGRGMRLELSGFDGRMRPSEIMRRGHWPSAPDITIQLIVGELQLRIGCYPVDMLYVVYDDDALELNGDTAFQDGDWRSLVRSLDEKATLHSIVAFSRTGWKGRHWKALTMKVPVKDYLNTIGNKPESSS